MKWMQLKQVRFNYGQITVSNRKFLNCLHFKSAKRQNMSKVSGYLLKLNRKSKLRQDCFSLPHIDSCISTKHALSDQNTQTLKNWPSLRHAVQFCSSFCSTWLFWNIGGVSINWLNRCESRTETGPWPWQNVTLWTRDSLKMKKNLSV